MACSLASCSIKYCFHTKLMGMLKHPEHPSGYSPVLYHYTNLTFVCPSGIQKVSGSHLTLAGPTLPVKALYSSRRNEVLSLQSVEQKKKIVKYSLTRGSQEITEKFNLGIEIVHGWFTKRGDSILCQYARMLSNNYV